MKRATVGIGEGAGGGTACATSADVLLLPPADAVQSGPRVSCDGQQRSLDVFASGFIIGNNTVYAPGGSARVICNHINFNASSFMSAYQTQPILASPCSLCNLTCGHSAQKRQPQPNLAAMCICVCLRAYRSDG